MSTGELTVARVSKRYEQGGARKLVIDDCSFALEPGKLTVMVGPSGCGKSTLVRLLAGFEPPSSGEVALDGEPIDDASRDRLVLFQESALFPWMTALDNVLYGPRARGQTGPDTRARAEQLLHRVGCGAFGAKYPAQLSGGMQRRVELARALINDPKVMILDEPFRGLDALTKELMWQYYQALCAESGRTQLFVTTDIDEALVLADRILLMTHVPTRVRAVIDVDLPRPRTLDDIARSERAAQLKRDALEVLHEEALRAFDLGSAPAAPVRPNPPPALALSTVGKSYRPLGADPSPVLAAVDLEIANGEIVVILGASGCGKSTLLRIVAGLDPEHEGDIDVDGARVRGPSSACGLVFQEPRLLPWLTVEQNVAFGVHELPPDERARTVGAHLALVGLSHCARAYPHQLSGGMAQRVALARALAPRPRLLLLDEPFAALDAITKASMQEELLRVSALGRASLLLVTHDIEEAVFLADRVALMSKEPGTIREVIPIELERPRDRTSHEFIHHRRLIAWRFAQGAV